MKFFTEFHQNFFMHTSIVSASRFTKELAAYYSKLGHLDPGYLYTLTTIAYQWDSFKVNPGKIVHCVFHLTNRLAKRQLNLKMDETVWRSTIKTPRIFFDRSLTYRPQLAHTRNKLRSRTNMVQKLTGKTWGMYG